MLRKYLLTAILLYQGIHLQAHQPYQATVTVGVESGHVSDPNLVDLMRDLKETALELLIPFYTPLSPVSIDINLRGIDTLASFAAGSTTLVVAIPQTGRIETFDGGTRDASLILFKDYIRDGGHHHNLLKAYAKYSPIDPIAGNPNSLLAQMGQSDYLLGRLSPLSGCDCWSAQPIVHQFQAGSYVGRAFSEGFDTTSITLPLRYSYSPGPFDWALILDAPLTFNANGGAYSVFSSLGVGVRIPLTSMWAVTPIVRFGAGGSLDLCTAGDFLSAGLNSVLNFKVCNHVLSMTNFAGYYSSCNLWLSGVNFNYHLHNYILKNGLTITSCEGIEVCNRPIYYSLYFVDSDFERAR